MLHRMKSVASESFSIQAPGSKRSAEEDDYSLNKDSFGKQLLEFVSFQPPQQYAYATEKPLPDMCVEIDSKEGREIFMEAMGTPYMESYLTISSQVDNQPDNMCAHTALLVVLNSLRISPARPTSYGVWRWHCFDSLVCCTLDKKKRNLTKEQFSRLAICNDLQAFPVTVTDALTLTCFRNWVKYCTAHRDVVLVVNFDRLYFCQNGFGHFAPIEGYHEERDLVLLAEVAKHKYPSHWVRLDHLVNAMNTPDNKTGKHRGFIIMTRPNYDPDERLFGLSSLFRLNESPGEVDTGLFTFVTEWTKWLRTEVTNVCHPTTDSQVVEKSVTNLLLSIPANVQSPFSLIDLTLVAFRHEQRGQPAIVARCRLPHDPRKCTKAKFIRNLQSTYLFQSIHRTVTKLSFIEKKRILGLVHVPFSNIRQALDWNKSEFENVIDVQKRIHAHIMAKRALGNELSTGDGNHLKEEDGVNHSTPCPGYIQLLPQHVAAVLLLSWPYHSPDELCLHEEITLENFLRTKTTTNEYFSGLNGRIDRSENFNGSLYESKNVAMNLYDISRSVLKPASMNRLCQEFMALNKKFRVVLNYHHLQ